MLISGFTIARNADKLNFPLIEVIQSVLPIVDEFIVALGDSDEDDNTLALLQSINDPKVKIVHRHWDESLFQNGEIFAHETTTALRLCRGDWCLYLQADEVIHEKELSTIQQWCKIYLNNTAVDGFLFNYIHFWGDYQHRINVHHICRKEIRLVRNRIGCYSYADAVSFRKTANQKLNVLDIPVRIFHYGYVRPPRLMNKKKRIQAGYHHKETCNRYSEDDPFDYGPIGGLPLFRETHPGVMSGWLQAFNWADQLNYRSWKPSDGVIHDQHKMKYRLLTWLENNFLNGRTLFGFKNYHRLSKKQILMGWDDNKTHSPFSGIGKVRFPISSPSSEPEKDLQKLKKDHSLY